MKNNHLYYIVFIFVAIPVMLISCSTSNELNDFVGTTTCKPPCWLGIQPGVTKSYEMVELLIDYEEREDGSFTLLDSGIYRWQSNKGNDAYIYADNNNIISKILLDFRPSSIKINEIINLLGEPSFLKIGKIRDGYFFYSIYYPKQGLAFVIAGGKKYNYNQGVLNFIVESKQMVLQSTFFQSSDVASMVNLLFGEDIVDEALQDIQDWKGYGSYSD